jgi:hypothetical protein
MAGYSRTFAAATTDWIITQDVTSRLLGKPRRASLAAHEIFWETAT